MEKKKLITSISSSKALQIALEDSETSHFIKTNFTYPEQYPEILSHKWISRDWQGYKWTVEIIEKQRFAMGKYKEMLNIARIEVDAKGRITRRQYLRNILVSEYKKFFKGKTKVRRA